MTPLQKSILNAVKRRPMTLRELQNNLQVDNSRLRTTVSAMVATGELSMRNGTYVPGFATYENAAAPNTIPCTLVKLAARFGFASRDDGEGDIFIIQSAALLCFLPELIVVCHFTTTVFYYKEKTSTNQDYKEDDYGT